mgnify:FL=1
MKGFSGFKNSPVKATDAGLVKAADLMDRGLKDPTSIIGEGVIGFLDGFKKSYKPETRSEAEIKQKKKEDSDNWWYNKGKGRSSDKDKRIEDKKFDEEARSNIISLEDINTSNVDAIELDIPNAKTRRNKRNRRRNRERP